MLLGVSGHSTIHISLRLLIHPMQCTSETSHDDIGRGQDGNELLQNETSLHYSSAIMRVSTGGYVSPTYRLFASLRYIQPYLGDICTEVPVTME